MEKEIETEVGRLRVGACEKRQSLHRRIFIQMV